MKKNMDIWLPSYLKTILCSSPNDLEGHKHIIFLFVDHFELAGKKPRLSEWLKSYPELALKHIDADGVHPKHSWFYALDLLIEEELRDLRNLTDNGFGEIELHWHHSFDTSETFQEKLHDGLKTFQSHGYLRPYQENKEACFGFIHGNWSLDNSCGDQFCGVSNEIQLLQEFGCYADFTFPALFSVAQPKLINSIYYAVDDGQPKSYSSGRVATVGSLSADNEFMIFQGPLTINWRDWRHKWHPKIEDGDINQTCTHNDPKRIDSWVKQGIHVQGQPDWIFVKVFCHGGQDHKAVLGKETDEMLSYLEKKYNDGVNCSLHYATAREAFNMVKAAEDGKTGSPHQYRDYLIPPPIDL